MQTAQNCSKLDLRSVPPIEAETSLVAFFHDYVERALREHGLDLTPRAEWYVVQVLAEQAKEPLPPDEPLAILLARSQQAETAEKVRELRALGDMTLVSSGFFAESLRRTMVDPEYYIAIGQAAYDEAGTLLRLNAPRRALADTLGEMAQRFPALVPVLAAIAEESSANGLDVVGLYERWLRTRSPVFERRLREAGMLLPTPTSEKIGLA